MLSQLLRTSGAIPSYCLIAEDWTQDNRVTLMRRGWDCLTALEQRLCIGTDREPRGYASQEIGCEDVQSRRCEYHFNKWQAQPGLGPLSPHPFRGEHCISLQCHSRQTLASTEACPVAATSVDCNRDNFSY